MLSFGFLKTGARIYIAIAGGIDVPLALGSRSTYPIGALGGFKGRAIAKGDELPVGAAARPRRGAASGRPAPPAGNAGRAARPAGPLLAPAHRSIAGKLLRGRLEGGAGSRPHGLSLPRRPAARLRRPRSSLSAPAPIRPTSSTAATPTARSRCRAAPSRSSCTAMRCRAAATSWSARSSRPTWT